MTSPMMPKPGKGPGEKVPSGYTAGRLQQFGPEQMQLFSQLFPFLGEGSFLQRLISGDPAMFAEMEAPALKQFAGMQGQLASRFSGAGLGGRHGSGFQLAAGQQASDFAQALQAQRMDLQRQALGDLMNYSQMILGQRPYETYMTPKEKPWWQEFLTGVGQTGIKSGIESMWG